MQIETLTQNNVTIAHIMANEIVISNSETAIDLIMNVQYQTGVKNIAISKDLIIDRFFILSTGIAGEILQKIVNYRFRIAIYGDYSTYTSKPLQDFIYESNKGDNIFFTENLTTALEKLTQTN